MHDPDLHLAYLAAGAPANLELPLLARRLLAACDGSRSAAESCRDAGIPFASQSAVLSKLLALGLLEPAFSREEEAFFATELVEDDFDEEGRREARDIDAVSGQVVGLFAAG